jgi:C-terminal processing protease CtpA/Prc
MRSPIRSKVWKLLVLSGIALSLVTPAPSRAADGDERASPLRGRGLDNLTAFTRLLGYVRFFHPSDQAAGANWNRVAIAGVQAIEKATSPQDLAQRLEAFFAPLAPTLRVFPDGQAADVPAELLPAAGGGTPTITWWSHQGVGLQRPTYVNQRLTNPVAPVADAGLPPTSEPLAVALGGGVSALLPLSLYRDSQGTIPHGSAAPPVPDKPAGWTPSGNDRATRLADVALAWTVFQHFYPYFDAIQADWPAELRKALASAAKDRDQRAFRDTLRRLVHALQDGHGRIYTLPFELSYQLPLTWELVENQLAVTSSQDSSVSPGDVVLAINNRPVSKAIAAAEALESAATPQSLIFKTLATLLAGPQGEAVKLRLRHAGRTVNVTLHRTIPYDEHGLPIHEPRPEKISEVRPGIFYLDVSRIDDDDFNAAVGRLAAARGIVFDFRGYPAKLSQVAMQHLVSGTVRTEIFNVPLITRPDRQGWRFLDLGFTSPPISPRFTAKAAFVISGEAISYAETYLGWVEAYHLGELVGGPTAGTNGNINPFTLPGQYVIVWTGMQVLKNDGSRLFGVGIQPTVPVSRTLAGVAAGRDEPLERAIEVVSQ